MKPLMCINGDESCFVYCCVLLTYTPTRFKCQYFNKALQTTKTCKGRKFDKMEALPSLGFTQSQMVTKRYTVKQTIAFDLSYLVVILEQFPWILEDLKQIKDRMGSARNDERIKAERRSIIGSMDAFERVWFHPVFVQAAKWKRDNNSKNDSGEYMFSSDEKLHTTTACKYGELLNTYREERQNLRVALSEAAEDVGLEYPIVTGEPPSISPVPFSESLVSMLVFQLLIQHSNLALSERVRQSLSVSQITMTYIPSIY